MPETRTRPRRSQGSGRGLPRGEALRGLPLLERAAMPVKFVPLGGLEEIGRNSAYFEYGNEIVMIDLGIQFPEEETPGIDYIIPNVAALEPKKKHIHGLIFTHGHYDHVAALPYLIEKIGNPVIYTAGFTKALIEKRIAEFPNLPKPKIEVVKHGDRVRISEHFEAEFFDIGHTIPDAIGVVLSTPVGKMAHFGDFRLDIGKDGKPTNLGVFERLGEMGIHSIFMDSTNSLKEGFSLSERAVEENLEKLFRTAKGRIILGIFASLVTRIVEIFKIAHRLDRKVAINGRSMKDNCAIAQQLGFLKPEKGQLIALEEIAKYKDDNVMILTTGSQGEPNAGLMRIVNGEHPTVSLKKTDTVIFSSSVIPGNEAAIQTLQDNIARQVDQVYNTKLIDIHVSGHACAEDLKLVMQLTKPKFVVPVHAYYLFRKHVTHLAREAGFPAENVVLLDNGQVAEITPNGFTITSERVPTFYVMVDGLGVGDVEEVVLRDRRVLAQEGMVVIILTIDRGSGRVLKNPDIISRGFIYLKNNKEILDEIRKRIREVLERIPRHQPLDADYLKTLLRNQIGQFLFNRTRRRPMILPVVIEI